VLSSDGRVLSTREADFLFALEEAQAAEYAAIRAAKKAAKAEKRGQTQPAEDGNPFAALKNLIEGD
jgi:hypothetical protein